MEIILTILCVLLILDTAVGNFVFPGKVEVIEERKRYYVRKRHRFLFFIRVWLWAESYYTTFPRDMLIAFSLGNKDQQKSKERAIHVAKVYSNSLNKEVKDSSVIWSSKGEKKDNFDMVKMKDLTLELSQNPSIEREKEIINELEIMHNDNK